MGTQRNLQGPLIWALLSPPNILETVNSSWPDYYDYYVVFYRSAIQSHFAVAFFLSIVTVIMFDCDGPGPL